MPQGPSAAGVAPAKRARRAQQSEHGSQHLRAAAGEHHPGNVLAEFVYGEQHSPSLVLWAGNVYRIVSDHLGSPRLVYNVASPYEIVLRRDYDEYGNIVLDELAGAWAAAGYRLPFGFAGGLYDPDTGLVRFGARDYDPVVGRWTSKDPIRFAGDGPNLYGYVLGDPVNFTDPSGLAKWLECGPCQIRIESDPHKGKHAHWDCRGGSTGCITAAGLPCDGSGPPPNRVRRCLEEDGFFETSGYCDAHPYLCAGGVVAVILLVCTAPYLFGPLYAPAF